MMDSFKMGGFELLSLLPPAEDSSVRGFSLALV